MDAAAICQQEILYKLNKLAVLCNPYTAAVPQPLFKARSQTTCFRVFDS